MIVPSGKWEVVDYMIHTGIYNSSVCCFIIFNLGRTFGEALNKVNSGFRGTFRCCCHWMEPLHHLA